MDYISFPEALYIFGRYISTFDNELMFLTEIQPTEYLLVVRALEQAGLVGLQERQTGV